MNGGVLAVAESIDLAVTSPVPTGPMSSRCQRVPLVGFDAAVAHNYTSTVKEIAYSRAAVRTLARMPRNLADRIRSRIRACAEDATSQAGNVRRLRLRVGDWRVVMRDADTLEVLHITTRGHAYRD